MCRLEKKEEKIKIKNESKVCYSLISVAKLDVGKKGFGSRSEKKEKEEKKKKEGKKEIERKKKEKDVYSIQYSRVVTLPSTN